MSAECQSVDGEWGGICPGCGKVLPNPPRIVSWKSLKPLTFTSGSSAGLGARLMSASRTEPSPLRDRQAEVLRIVEKNNGNRRAAARELGCTESNVVALLARLKRQGVAVPAPSTHRRSA